MKKRYRIFALGHSGHATGGLMFYDPIEEHPLWFKTKGEAVAWLRDTADVDMSREHQYVILEIYNGTWPPSGE